MAFLNRMASHPGLVHLQTAKWNLGPDYRVVNYLGSGAYGHVCEAIHVPTKKRVAIKKMELFSTTPVDSMRILREIQILRKLNHPCVVRLFDII